MKHEWVPSLLVLLALVIAGCSSEPDPTPTTAPTATPSPSPTFTRTPTPLPTDTPTSTPTPGPLSASEVFELISPSIAFLETGISSGSGLLTEGGYVLTNAHVVWPYNEVRVVFPDGSEYLDTPVVGWDLLADLAVLGPIEADLPAIELVDGEDKVIGSDVYLIGYPGEVDSFPKPSISRGLISRMREWDLVGVSYFQTEAALAGGQSGGVLVTDRGEVIGISGLRFTEADFGVIASAIDLRSRIDKLVRGEPLDDIDARAISLTGGDQTHRFFDGPGETRAFVVELGAGEEIELEVSGDEHVLFDLVDPAGTYLLSTADGARVNRRNTGKAEYDGPHFLVVGRDYMSISNNMTSLSSNEALEPYSDNDDDKALPLGKTYYGSLDYPGDYDRFTVVMSAGDFIHIKVESIMVDPVILITYEGAGEEQEAWDDDTGKGVLGTDAELSYFAPHAGIYEVLVFGAYDIQIGGYAISVDTWQPGQPTPVVPASTPTPIASEVGDMRRHEGDLLPFNLEIPAGMIEAPGLIPDLFEEVCSLGIVCLIDPSTGLLLFIVEADLELLGFTNLDEFADQETRLTVDVAGGILVSRENGLTGNGLEVVFMTTELYGLVINRLLTISDGTAISISYGIMSDRATDVQPTVDYSFSTFDVPD